MKGVSWRSYQKFSVDSRSVRASVLPTIDACFALGTLGESRRATALAFMTESMLANLNSMALVNTDVCHYNAYTRNVLHHVNSACEVNNNRFLYRFYGKTLMQMKNHDFTNLQRCHASFTTCLLKSMLLSYINY